MTQSIASTYDEFGRAGRHANWFFGRVARTDTSAKDLFTLPRGTIPVLVAGFGSATASNAGTNATISVGSTGVAGFFVAGWDVKTAHAITNLSTGLSIPSSAANLGEPLEFDTIVTGTYAEAGSASTAGGPWTIGVLALLDV